MKGLLHELVFAAVREYPHHIAVMDHEKSMTYLQLNDLCSQYANILSSCKVKKGDRIGIFSNKSVEVMAAILAIMQSGAIFVPINNAPESDDLSYIINDCGIELLFADDSVLKKLKEQTLSLSGLKYIVMIGNKETYDTDQFQIIEAHLFDHGVSEGQPAVNIIGNDLAYIYYTSGTTGIPKGVMISHHSICFVINYRRAVLNYHSGSVTLSLCALHFDPVINEMFCTLSVGGKLIFIAGNNSITLYKNFQNIIRKEAITIFFCVPSFLNILKAGIAKLAGSLGDLRYVVFGAGMCSPSLIQKLSEALPKVTFVHGYGLTETSVTACSYQINDPWDVVYESYPIGDPIENTEFYVVNENQIIESGVGELVIRGPHLMQGYWGKEEETDRVLRNNPLFPKLNEKVLFTGDLVRVEKDFELIFVGRKDEQIKSAGHRIELGEVEMRIGKYHGVQRICVIAVPDEAIDYMMHGYCVLNQDITIEDVKDYCNNNLLSYMIPQHLYAVNELPQNANGKIDKKKLLTIHHRTVKNESEV